jgi:hypothetical protein
VSAGVPASLFTEALHVVNRALEAHKGSEFYQRFVSASAKHPADREYGIAVYDRDPSAPFDFFTLRFRDGSLEMISRATRAPQISWRIPRAYLERIVDDPEAFIEDPARVAGIDWQSLKQRLGIES